jgi:hypothetical protein
MQIVFHAGVHATDEDRLLRCLLRNKDDFRTRGINIPGPSRYRRLLREAMHALENAPPGPNARDILLESLLDDTPGDVDLLVLSDDSIFCIPRLALRDNRAYPKAGPRLRHLQSLFAGDEIELFLAIRNPATWMPALFAKTPLVDFGEILNGTHPLEFRWAELVERIRSEAPEVRLTVWCNEDTPLIWGQIVREVAALDPGTKITGAFDLLAEIMSKEGMQRFRAYLREHPVMTEMQKRRVMSAFLDKFADESEIEEELDIPGWTEELVDTLSVIYDDDVLDISRMQGVNFIAP